MGFWGFGVLGLWGFGVFVGLEVKGQAATQKL